MKTVEDQDEDCQVTLNFLPRFSWQEMCMLTIYQMQREANGRWDVWEHSVPLDLFTLWAANVELDLFFVIIFDSVHEEKLTSDANYMLVASKWWSSKVEYISFMFAVYIQQHKHSALYIFAHKYRDIYIHVLVYKWFLNYISFSSRT